jgi:hypothetical protein
LSVKQCLRQRIYVLKVLAGGLASWSFFSQICLASLANSLLPQKQLSPAAKIGAWKAELSPHSYFESSLAANEPVNVDMDSDLRNKQTSVSELSDVKPTDWAYQALRSLIERYGVISGYPDGTFGGNRPLSRYEFAAALAATLEQVEGLITNGEGDRYIQEDAIVLRRLQTDYRLALEDLQQRLNRIDRRTIELNANQFSPTTKLQGQQIIALSDGSDANKTVISRSRLTLSTSFNQQNLLVTQLESGNNGGDATGLAQQEQHNLLGVAGFIANGGGLDYAEVESSVKLRRLYYTFRPWQDVALTVGAKMLPRDFIDRNRYANNEAIDFSSSFFLNNPLIVLNQIDRNGGAGAAILWNPGGGNLSLQSLYIAADANLPNANITEGGLFGDRYQASVEVEYLPSDKIALRLQYTNALINNTDINTFGINAEYALNRNTGIFGRFGFGSYNGFNTAINENLDLHPFSWAVGLGSRNFMLPGTVAGIAIGQPFVSDNLGSATQTNFEAFYNLQLSDNLSITPAFSLVTNPDNDSSKGTIWQSTLRSVFSF